MDSFKNLMKAMIHLPTPPTSHTHPKILNIYIKFWKQGQKFMTKIGVMILNMLYIKVSGYDL